MSDAGESRPWRAALVTSLVSISLTPLAAMVGYYSGKVLAAPKLSIQYATPVIETAPLAIDKSMGQTVQQIIRGSEATAPYVGGNPFFQSQCVQELGSASVSLDCANQFRAGMPQLLDSMDFEKNLMERDRQAIEAWNGKTEIALTPLYLPELGESLEASAYNNKQGTINILRNYENSISDQHKAGVTLLATLSDFVAAPAKRTGKVSFKVGVLNSGDSDGVIFPSATLSSHNFDLTLRNTPPFTPFPYAAVNPTTNGSFNVVRAHSFSEVDFVVDDTKTLPVAQDSWRSAVKSGTQEDFTIQLTTSGRPIGGKGQLPP
ncbi:MAG: hypothetical protein ACREQC_07675 [Candidatus Binataceae bacterium]